MLSSTLSAILALTVLCRNPCFSTSAYIFYRYWIVYSGGYHCGAVVLVAEQDYINRLVAIVVGLGDPKLYDVVERVRVGHIVDHDDPIRSLVVGRGDGAEAFLTCRVPDLELDVFIIVLDGLEPEVHADGRQVVLVKLVVRKLGQDGGLPHA